ncbi:MAG: flavin-dependent dehydrogenase, partial [Microcystaceae cyanobacterium]
MHELLYIEVPTPETQAVLAWLQQDWQPLVIEKRPHLTKVRLLVQTVEKQLTPVGLRLSWQEQSRELGIFIWSVQRTTYLKIFAWGNDHQNKPNRQEKTIIDQLLTDIRVAFPSVYPVPPQIDLSQQSIFTALAPFYPQTVHFFQKMPEGEYDLQRVYWWEKRWRDAVQNPQQPKQVIYTETQPELTEDQHYDLIYIGGALGAVHAAVMAQLGYRVLLIERLPFGRMNREWNISRGEFQRLIDLGLFTAAEFEGLIAREYKDGFNKFFDAYNPPHLKAKVLHTPTVLNIAIDSAKLLKLCGEKLLAAGGEIWDQTEFIRADIDEQKVTIQLIHL